MKLDFNLSRVRLTEFGVGRDTDDGQAFTAVPVDADVQGALREMVEATVGAMNTDEDGPRTYEPSEKHGSTEYLILPLGDPFSLSLRQFHTAANLHLDGAALEDPTAVFCYFARLTDQSGRRLTALRRAAQFKGVLKKRLIRIVSDSLKLVGDNVFKLDNDFDLLVDSQFVHIWRPSGFEAAGKLQQAILDAVPENIAAIRKNISFVRFDSIEAFAATRPRAARYLASIRSRTKKIDKALLKALCMDTGVDLTESSGKVLVSEGHEMDFLEVLDRRRYKVSLVRENSEQYRAASRTEI